jgi:acyl-CoA thioester hydrolase
MSYQHAIRPRYDEVDMGGVVFNAHWLSYFDEASLRFFEELGHSPTAPIEGFNALVVKAAIEWRGPAGLSDQITIDLEPSRLGTSSFDLRYVARVRGTEVCAATITYVSIDTATARSCPIPARIRDALRQHSSS